MTEMRIEKSEIHLWQLEEADFELSSLQSECLAWLTETELKRFQRYQFDQLRKQLLLGRVLIRIALSSYDSSVAPASWNFTYNDYGKPAISEEQNRLRTISACPIRPRRCFLRCRVSKISALTSSAPESRDE